MTKLRFSIYAILFSIVVPSFVAPNLMAAPPKLNLKCSEPQLRTLEKTLLREKHAGLFRFMSEADSLRSSANSYDDAINLSISTSIATAAADIIMELIVGPTRVAMRTAFRQALKAGEMTAALDILLGIRSASNLVSPIAHGLVLVDGLLIIQNKFIALSIYKAGSPGHLKVERLLEGIGYRSKRGSRISTDEILQTANQRLKLVDQRVRQRHAELDEMVNELVFPSDLRTRTANAILAGALDMQDRQVEMDAEQGHLMIDELEYGFVTETLKNLQAVCTQADKEKSG